MLHLLTLLTLAGAVSASWSGNLNYRSPSHHHPGLGVSIHKVNKRNAGAPPLDASKLNFTHGVASGDPYPESVILWTRCAPMFDDGEDNTTVSGYVPLYNPVPIYKDTDEHLPPSTAPVCLDYKIAQDKALTKCVRTGRVFTSSDIDYTVKVGVKADLTKMWIYFSTIHRSKQPSSSHSRSTTTSSLFAAPTRQAHLDVRRQPPKQMIRSPRSI